MLVAARDANVKRILYARSNSIYGDHPGVQVKGSIFNYLDTERQKYRYAATCIGIHTALRSETIVRWVGLLRRRFLLKITLICTLTSTA